MERLNGELRCQRHDYSNHLQVVYGLIQLGEYEELQKYFEPVYKDIQKTGKAFRTSKPAINALLKAKMEEAETVITKPQLNSDKLMIKGKDRMDFVA